jgi:uncharacterized membrane protein YhaH (DUF805 family)
MVYRSKRHRKNFLIAALIFLLLTVVFFLLFRFWKLELTYYFAIVAVLSLTIFIAICLAWFQQRKAILGVVAVGLLLSAGIYLVRD